MKLLLNEQEVYPKKDTSIKLIKENPIMTGSGTYTFDVEIPMSNGRNQQFFGHVNRFDVTKERITYDMKLFITSDEGIVGTAVITEITQEVVKLQLVAGNSNINFWNQAEIRYIDEYDYNGSPEGDIVLNWISKHEDYNYIDWTDDSRSEEFKDKGWRVGNILDAESSGFMGVTGKFAIMPFIDEDIDEKNVARKGNTKARFLQTDGSYKTTMFVKNAHPNLLYVAEKICGYMGYTPDFSWLRERNVQDIYIACARPYTSLAMMLPHWTVKEFFTQFCHLFNITLLFDDVSKTVSVSSNKRLSDNVVVLDKVVDSFETKMQDDEKDTNILLSSIAYASSNNHVQNMDKNERSKYRTVNLDDFTEEAIKTAYNKTQANERNWCFYGKDSNIWTIDSDGKVHDTDVFRPLNRGTEECEELKIVPAKTTFENMGATFQTSEYSSMDTGESFYHGTGQRIQVYKEGTMFHTYEGYRRVLALANGYGGYQKATGSLWQKLNGGETKEEHGEKEDYMPVYMVSKKPQPIYANKHSWDCVYERYCFINNTKVNLTAAKPEEYPYEQDKGTDKGVWWCDNCEELIPFTDMFVDGFNWNSNRRDCLASFALGQRYNVSWNIWMFHSEMPKYNIGAENTFRFLSFNIPDTTAVFIIRGKRYVCKKIECDINEDGIDLMMTGYFVEILP